MEISNHHRRFLSSALIVACATMTGCMDDNYDLSDIDTTVQVSVNDLVLPIQIDPITLGDIIDLDSDSRIKEIDGIYALLEEGTFQSDPVFIDPITIGAPYIAPLNINLNSRQMNAAAPKASAISLPVGRHTTQFSYTTSNVSDCIKAIQHIGTQFHVSMTLSVNDPSGVFTSSQFTDLQLQLPAGLEGTPSAGTYDATTGIASLGNMSVNNGIIEYAIDVTGINASQAKIQFSADRHTFSFDDEIGIAGGNIEPSSIPSTLPSGVSLSISFSLSDLSITSFSGVLNYSVNDFSINPITLNDLPSVLDQPETNLSLANPQIYLSINNPLSSYGITAEAGLSITPWRDGHAGQSYSPDNGMLQLDRSTQAGTGAYEFCLAPENPSKYQPGYAEAAFRPYTGLRNILSGDGLPDELRIDVINPGMPQQQVTDLRIGTNEGPISGNYTFFAPLALTAGSQIVYTDTESGWNDAETDPDDNGSVVDHLTINTLEVSATVTNDLPVSVHISGYPIDVNGNRINNVEITGADIAGGTANQPLVLRMTGTVTHLDGITFTARATASDGSAALAPSQKITLTDIRAKVSGYFNKEL